MHWTHGRTKVR